MSDENALPTMAELQELIEKLAPANEDMDEVSASIILERAGVDLGTLSDDLKTRLEQGVEEMRTNGEEIPVALVEILALMDVDTQSSEPEEIDPGAWIDTLLAGGIPQGMESMGHQAPPFRSLKADLLTEEDIRILEELAAEIQSRAKKKEG